MRKQFGLLLLCLLVMLPALSVPAAGEAKLAVDIFGGLPVPLFNHRVGGAIVNTGDAAAYNLSLTLTIIGGIDRRINTTVEHTLEELAPGTGYGFGITETRGLGTVIITLSASASNAENATRTVKGIQLWRFTWVPLSWVIPLPFKDLVPWLNLTPE
ncbi:MAG: hypothetical protein WC525_07275 [Candidatus Thermoplasmatota archaeon]